MMQGAMMRAFCIPTFSLLLLVVLFCEAHPSSDSRNDHRFHSDIEETNAEILAELIDRMQGGSETDNWTDEQLKEHPDAAKELRILGDRNPPFFGDSEIEDRSNTDTVENSLYDYEVDKRAASKIKYNYYRCYFNPVTCYRK